MCELCSVSSNRATEQSIGRASEMSLDMIRSLPCACSQSRSRQSAALCEALKPLEFQGRCFRNTRRPKRPSLKIQAALPDTTALAVTQQGAVFAVTVVAEGIFTRTQLPAGASGRPAILPVLATTIGLAAALVLMRLGEQGERVGLIAGGTTSALMLAVSIKRAIDTEGDPNEWPGPKAWPAFISTGAFFAMLAFFQALQYL